MTQLVVALDYTDAMDALTMANSLRGHAPWVKVGLEQFTSDGHRVVQTLKGMGFNVMLDLKMFDIPNTVAGGLRSSSMIGADMVTIHLLGGERMCRMAMEEIKGLKHKPLVFGVTVLTSMEQGELPVPGVNLSELVLSLAGKAADWGLNGIVCSGQELAQIKKAHPTLQCLVPGIRPSGTAQNDQKRIITPEQAHSLGAEYIVVGRPITKATDPANAAKAIINSMKD